VTLDLTVPELHATGVGPPVLLLHPLGVDHTVWAPLTDRLPGFTLLTYDLPGHGRSPAPQRRCTETDLAEQAARLLSGAEVGPAHVVGVSLGGLVAQVLAARHPDLVDHLVVVDAVDRYPPAMRTMWQDRAELVRRQGMAPVVDATLELWFTGPARETGGDVVDGVRRLLEATDPEGYARACEVLATADTGPLLPSITAPTLLVCGEQDAPAFTAAAPRLAEEIAGGELVWLEGSRHAGALEHPEAFAEALSAFLPRPPADR
jgi:3-oxoadipate enol-lactonase